MSPLDRGSAHSHRVYDFREQIHQLTSVPTVRQKVIGLSKGKLAAELDSTRFGTLGVKKDCKFTMIGTPESDTFKDPSEVKATVSPTGPPPPPPGSGHGHETELTYC